MSAARNRHAQSIKYQSSSEMYRERAAATGLPAKALAEKQKAFTRMRVNMGRYIGMRYNVREVNHQIVSP